MIVLTGVKGSGIDEIEKTLISVGYKRPIIFSTATPEENKFDEIVFIKENIFIKKMIHGDFIYWKEQDGILFGISKTINKDTVIIADNSEREKLKEYARENNIPIKTYYINIDEKEQIKNLNEKRYSWSEVKNYLSKRNNYSPSTSCSIWEGIWDKKLFLKLIDNVNE